MESREVPAVKGRPRHIPYLLRIVNENPGKYYSMVQDIHEFMCAKKKRRKPPSVQNSVNMTLPTLRLLRLVKGEEENTRLTVRGEKMLDASRDEKGSIVEPRFRRVLAPHLLELERRYYVPVAQVAQEVSENKGEPASSLEELLRHVAMQYGVKAATKDRLQAWLRYLRFVGFVSKTSKGYEVNSHQVKAALREPVNIDKEKFKQALMQAYNRLSNHRRSPFLPIPEIRESVLRFFDGQLWDEDFDDYLGKIKKEDSRYVISFAEPMYPKSDGFSLDGSYYYYIIIRDKEKI